VNETERERKERIKDTKEERCKRKERERKHKRQIIRWAD
jgi:hypothetical protein